LGAELLVQILFPQPDPPVYNETTVQIPNTEQSPNSQNEWTDIEVI
jgi:hypothetical protein